MPREDRKNYATKVNLEKEQADLTGKDESIESTATNNILEQQQDIIDPNVIGEENSILRHSKFDDTKTEVANTNNVHEELDNDDESDNKNESLKQISTTYSKAKVDQDNEIQSPVSSGYVTPPERSEPSDIKTVHSEDSTKQKDGANPEGLKSEENTITNDHEDSTNFSLEVLSGDDESLLGFSKSDDTKAVSVHNPENQGYNTDSDTSNLEEDPKLEESEYEAIDGNYESKVESPNSDENLEDDNVGVTKHNRKGLYKGDDTEVMSNSPQKKTFKFANFSKGEKALLLFVALSSSAFIASFISSVLGKPLCPDEKGNLISLAILGTVAIISIAVSLAYFHYPNKSKNDPSANLNTTEVEMLELNNKKNI